MKLFVHLLAFLVSLFLLISLSLDLLTDNDPLQSTSIYYAVSIFYVGDFFWQLSLASDKRRFWRNYWPVLLLSIPLLSIEHLLSIEFHEQWYHTLRFLPIVRSFWAIYFIVGWWVRNIAGRLLLTYSIIDLFVIYFSSLLFFRFEMGFNPDVHDYADALWFSAMNFTTIGSNIIATTVVGKVLGVLLGLSGMTLLPVFTAFVSGQIAKIRSHEHPMDF